MKEEFEEARSPRPSQDQERRERGKRGFGSSNKTEGCSHHENDNEVKTDEVENKKSKECNDDDCGWCSVDDDADDEADEESKCDAATDASNSQLSEILGWTLHIFGKDSLTCEKCHIDSPGNQICSG